MGTTKQPPWVPWRDRRGRISPLRIGALLILAAPAVSMLVDTLSGAYYPRPIVSLIYYSGVWATALLMATLLISPLRRILRWNSLIGVRRMFGVAALAYSLAHAAIYLLLRDFDWSLMAWELGNRLTISVALVAILGLAVLGTTSTDRAIRRIGAARWRLLHRSVYVLSGLAILHFLLSPGSIGGLPFFMTGCYAWLMGWRLLERRRLGGHTGALTGLAFAACAFTMTLEMVWPWLLQGYDPIETFLFNFGLVLGVSPAWKVLILGMLLVVLARLPDWRHVRLIQHTELSRLRERLRHAIFERST